MRSKLKKIQSLSIYPPAGGWVTASTTDGRIVASRDSIWYNEQDITANKLLSEFKNINQVLLAAQTQSGKTGVCAAVCQKMSNWWAQTHSGASFRPFYLLNVNDNSLRDQAMSDLQAYVMPDDVMTTPQMMSDVKRIRRSLKAYPNDLHFIIVDESHYGTTKSDDDSQIHKVLGVSRIILNGTRKLPNNVKVLTVSATPMAEVASFFYDQVKASKKMVVHIPGPTYYGLGDMLRLGRLYDSFKITSDGGLRELSRLIESYRYQRKYILIRMRKNDSYRKLQRVTSVRVIPYNSDKREITFPTFTHKINLKEALKVQPDKLTVIVISGMCRMGMVLDTANVCMAFENSIDA